VGAEVAGVHRKGLGPTVDAGAEGCIDILKSLFGGSGGGGVAGLADPVEDAASLRLLFGFVAKKREFEGYVWVSL
jgi:hypothetical protein